VAILYHISCLAKGLKASDNDPDCVTSEQSSIKFVIVSGRTLIMGEEKEWTNGLCECSKDNADSCVWCLH